LVYLALATAGASLAKSVIDLIIAIIKARSEGTQRGDHPREPLELIVRRTEDGGKCREQIVLRIGHEESVDDKRIQGELVKALRKLATDKKPRKRS
jgi:hypothetical protein